ncbi:MAG TPA: hypothetical protein VH500_08715 [Nitrososphaeraceae archaeon]|jgi:hypothetical protein
MYEYTTYLSEISGYEKPNLEETEKSLLYRIMNTYESSARRIASHLNVKRLSSQHKSQIPTMKRLQEYQFIKEVQQSSLFRDSRYYKLTTFGLFYIFSNTLNYSPQLLTDHRDSSILKALLFQYLQPNTIRQSTGRFYAIITQYLNDCCRITANGLSKFKPLNNIELGPIQLDYDLRQEAKVLGTKLTIMYNESNLLAGNPDITDENKRLSLYEQESTMKTILSRDGRFLEFLDMIYREFRETFSGF